MSIDIVWEDSRALVVNKPNGLLTTAARGINSLEIALKAQLKERESIAQDPFIGLPHRIDRPVSGAVLVGKTQKATKVLCAQFQARKIEKTYYALVAGVPSENEGSWVDWMRKIPDRAAAEIVDSSHSDARKAILEYQTIEQSAGRSLLRIRLQTGRTHQIRLQCAHRGMPIVGDFQYGSEIDFGPPVLSAREQPIALHAAKIGFNHPKTAVWTQVEVPFPKLWVGLGFSLIGQSPSG